MVEWIESAFQWTSIGWQALLLLISALAVTGLILGFVGAGVQALSGWIGAKLKSGRIVDLERALLDRNRERTAALNALVAIIAHEERARGFAVSEQAGFRDWDHGFEAGLELAARIAWDGVIESDRENRDRWASERQRRFLNR